MPNINTHIMNLSLNNINIELYRFNNKIFMKIDPIYGKYIKGLDIYNNKIITSVILNNSYVYLPDIIFNTNKDLLTAIIKRDIFIENESNKYTYNNIDLLKKKKSSILLHK